MPLLPALGRELIGLYNVLPDKCLLGVAGSHQTVYANDATYGGGLMSSRIGLTSAGAGGESQPGEQEAMSMDFPPGKILDIENYVNLCGW